MGSTPTTFPPLFRRGPQSFSDFWRFGSPFFGPNPIQLRVICPYCCVFPPFCAVHWLYFVLLLRNAFPCYANSQCFIALCCSALHCASIHHNPFRFVSFRIAVHLYAALHYVAVHFVLLHYAALHYTPLFVRLRHCLGIDVSFASTRLFSVSLLSAIRRRAQTHLIRSCCVSAVLCFFTSISCDSLVRHFWRKLAFLHINCAHFLLSRLLCPRLFISVSPPLLVASAVTAFFSDLWPRCYSVRTFSWLGRSCRGTRRVGTSSRVRIPDLLHPPDGKTRLGKSFLVRNIYFLVSFTLCITFIIAVHSLSHQSLLRQ